MAVIVGIPVYKARKTLPAALDSLVAQTKKNFFTVLSIDCDGENYDDIIEEYERRGLNISVINAKENGGPGVARQRIIDAAPDSVEYITFLDADDCLMPRAIEALTREANVNNADVVMAKFTGGYGEGSMGGEISNTAPRVVWCHGKLYRLSYLKENNIRFLDWLRLNEDSYFNSIACFATDKLYILNESVYLWNCTKGSLTRSDNGRLGYLEKSHDSFITSQILSLQKRYELNPKKLKGEDCLGTLAQIYNLCALQKELDWKGFEYMDSFKILQTLPPLQEALATKEGFTYFMEHIWNHNAESDKIIYFTLNPIEWIKDYIKSDLYEWENFL